MCQSSSSSDEDWLYFVSRLRSRFSYLQNVLGEEAAGGGRWVVFTTRPGDPREWGAEPQSRGARKPVPSLRFFPWQPLL